MLKKSFLLLFIFFSSIAFAKVEVACEGQYKGKTIERDKIVELIEKDSSENLNLCGANLEHCDLGQLVLMGADLSYANLIGANLEGSDLSRTNLSHAQLDKANLTNTYFYQSDLSYASLLNVSAIKANFKEADLKYAYLDDSSFSWANFQNAQLQSIHSKNAEFNKADFSFANFEKAYLVLSKFQEADFSAANLTKADAGLARFTKADLTKAILTDANFTKSSLDYAVLDDIINDGTNYSYANVYKMQYMPRLGALPIISSLASTKNFETIEFYDPTLGPSGLMELRSAYKKSGFRSMERLLTNMIKTQEMQEGWRSQGVEKVYAGLSYIFFYLTSDFGYSTYRPLVLFGILIFIFAVPYSFIISGLSDEAAIYKVEASDEKKLRKDSWVACYFQSLYFSLLMAFRIGWEDFNIANWISRMQTTPYKFRARGWVRTVSGAQSLLGAYLLIFWIMIHFGHPFEW